jgi:hypothetical protein
MELDREKLKLEVQKIIYGLAMLKPKEYDSPKHVSLVSRLNKLDTILDPDPATGLEWSKEELKRMRAKRCAWNFRKR